LREIIRKDELMSDISYTNKKVKKILFNKKCKHPDCNVMVETYSRNNCFCEKHKKVNYYLKKEKKIDNVNKIIKHSHKSSFKIIEKCELCQKEFELTLLPKIFKYPKYCENHRNEHKRNMYLKNF
jgi:hypothetical protein